MFCKNCGNELDDDAKFCTNCGENVLNSIPQKYCIHCGNILEEDAVFCTKCGNKTIKAEQETSLVVNEQKDQKLHNIHHIQISCFGRIKRRPERDDLRPRGGQGYIADSHRRGCRIRSVGRVFHAADHTVHRHRRGAVGVLRQGDRRARTVPR